MTIERRPGRPAEGHGAGSNPAQDRQRPVEAANPPPQMDLTPQRRPRVIEGRAGVIIPSKRGHFLSRMTLYDSDGQTLGYEEYATSPTETGSMTRRVRLDSTGAELGREVTTYNRSGTALTREIYDANSRMTSRDKFGRGQCVIGTERF